MTLRMGKELGNKQNRCLIIVPSLGSLQEHGVGEGSHCLQKKMCHSKERLEKGKVTPE